MTQCSRKSSHRDLIPRIIHFCVLPPMTPTPDIECRIQVAREFHPGWEIRIWRDGLDPASFRLSYLWRTVSSGAQLSDLIRVEVVQQFGGFYADADVDFHRSLEPLRDNGFVICPESGNMMGNAFFGAIPNHPALQELVLAHSQLEALPNQIPPNISTGPEFFTRYLQGREDVTLIPRELIFSFAMGEAPGKPPPAAFATHLWHGSWLRKSPPLRYRAARAAIIRRLDRAVDRFLNRYGSRRGAYPLGGDLVVRTAHGHQIVANGSDSSVMPQLAFTGYHLRQEELFVKQLVKGGDWCIDLGADNAVFSLLFGACVGPLGRVFSYAMDTLARRYLEKSVRLNRMNDRVAIGDLAVGEQTRTVQRGLPQDRPADASAVDLPLKPNWPPRSNDLALTLGSQASVDAIFPDWAIFSCVRIAVVGHELELLKGCRRLLEEKRIKCLIIEARRELRQEAFFLLVSELRDVARLGYDSGLASNNGDFTPMEFESLVRLLHVENWIFLRA